MDDDAVKDFVGEREPVNSLLDLDNPVSYGSFAMSEYYFEIKRQQIEAHKKALELYDGIAREFEAVSGRYYPMIDCYRTEDADQVIVIMSSASGAVKDVVDEMREKGHKVGCLRIRMFRPFPVEAVRNALKGKKAVAVLDRSLSLGGTAPLVAEVRSALYAAGEMIPINSCIYGLGGRDFFPQYAEDIFMDLINGRMSPEEHYIGLLE